MRRVSPRTRAARLKAEQIEAERDHLRAVIDVEKRSRELISGVLSDLENRRRERTVKASATHRGAEYRSTWDGWHPRLRSPDQDIADERDRLVARCRDLARNNPIARALIEAQVGHVVGASAWSVQSTTRADRLAGVLTEQQVREWRSACEDVWEEATETLDARGEGSFWELLRTAYRAYLDADAFLWLDRKAPREGRRRIGVSCWVVEGDLCRTPQKYAQDRAVSLGVLYRRDHPSAYFIFDRYPDDLESFGAAQTYRKVWREDLEGRPQLLHLFRALRPGQSRGLPWLTPVAADLEDAGGYQEAEFMAARVAACISLIRKRTTPGRRPDDEPVRLEPGGIVDSYQGETIETFNPSRPTTQFAAFMERVEKICAAALGFSSMLALRDFTHANYSVSRSTLFDARRTFESEQQWLKRAIGTVYEAVIESAWLDGLLPPVPLFDAAGRANTITRELMRSSPIPPAFGWIDPTQEVDAYKAAIDAGLASHREVLSMLGRDWEQTFADLAEEQQRKRDLGIAATEEEIASTGTAPADDACESEPQDAGPEDEAEPVEQEANA